MLHLLRISAVILLAVATFADAAPNAVGSYELQGIREMAGSLVLKPNHRYRASFSYGAADWTEQGVWKGSSNSVVLERGRFGRNNSGQIELLLSPGMRLVYREGRLASVDPDRKLVFIDPSRTPSRRGTTGEAGAGRMRVNGTVVKLDANDLVVKVANECITFDVSRLSAKMRGSLRGKQGKVVDLELPYSAIVSGGSCF